MIVLIGATSNAETDGLEKDLNFNGNQYSLLLVLFYIPFGLCDLPWNLATKRLSGRVTLPIMGVAWGVLSLLQCACSNYGGLLAIRIILGVFEGGLYSGVTFYLTLFYKRNELGFRLAIFQSMAVLSAAFSGLIAYGVFGIDNPNAKGWQWLFIIEGSLTFIVGVLSIVWLPSCPQRAWFLSQAEKDVAVARGLRDSSSELDTTGHRLNWKQSFQEMHCWMFPGYLPFLLPEIPCTDLLLASY